MENSTKATKIEQRKLEREAALRVLSEYRNWMQEDLELDDAQSLRALADVLDAERLVELRAGLNNKSGPKSGQLKGGTKHEEQ